MLRFSEKRGNALKTVLCVDLGGVLIDFDEKYFLNFIRPEKKSQIYALINLHETHQILLRDLFRRFKEEGYFKKSLFWEDFVQIYAECMDSVHEPMFGALEKLKIKKTARLVCVSDNNPFCFYLTTLRFPQIFELFREGEVDQWVLSYEIHSVKTQLNPFPRAESLYGFSLSDAGFVDNRQDNLDAFVRCGGDPDACFLYNMKNKRNHAQFLKFLDKHFPPR